MDTYIEFCIHFWEVTRELDLYSMDGSQLDRLIVDALLKTNGGKELLKTSMNELSVLIRAINHNNRKIQWPSLPSNLDEAAKKYTNDSLNNLGAILRVNVSNAFKAGAEWMAGQGITVDGTFHHSRGYPSVIELKTYLRDYEGADVIVQIRKK